MAIECVFFDFDGVLRVWEYDEEKFEEMYGVPIDAIREVAFDPVRLESVVRGHITNEEWRADVGEEIRARFPEENAVAALADWNTRIGRLIPEAIEIVEECKEVVPVALFSNATTRLPQELAHHGLTNLFDFVVNASETGFMKPEPEIFHRALEIAGVRAENAFFTDDSKRNVEVAASLGWTAHYFQNVIELRDALVDASVLNPSTDSG